MSRKFYTFAAFTWSGLGSLSIPNGVETLGSWCFYNCLGLTSVVIPNSVTTIGDVAFANNNLTELIIGNSVTHIGLGNFASCEGISSITCSALTPPVIESSTFQGISTNIPVHVPCESETAYKSAGAISVIIRTVSAVV
ncbi:MAG: leucine-rich repeat domain-containing protein [Bacteroidales bacterium]|nr:leucine-rich repeat domain-containing protein [Bacteroidales bacterium]